MPQTIAIRVVIAALVGLFVCVGIIGYDTYRTKDPVLAMMEMLDDHTKLCVNEIAKTGIDGDECTTLVYVADKIFGSSPVKWGKDLILNGSINHGNVDEVNSSLKRYSNTLSLITASRKARISI